MNSMYCVDDEFQNEMKSETFESYRKLVTNKLEIPYEIENEDLKPKYILFLNTNGKYYVAKVMVIELPILLCNTL